MRNHFIFIIILWFSLLGQVSANTGITFKITRIPMAEAGPNGLEALLVWPNDAKANHPVVIISHGAPPNPAQHAKMNVMDALPIAVEFERRGFAVAVFMRRGYGSSFLGSTEASETCASPNYLQAAADSSQDLHAVIRYLATIPQFDTNKIIAVGVSAGGFATVALSADNPPPGLIAAISFAGGLGSDGKNTVCQPDDLVAAFAKFGQTSRIPMLWIYAENDHFFNPTLAQRMYAAFIKSGGKAKLIIAPAYGKEGHGLFSNAGIANWTPLVDDFLKSQGLVFVDKLLPMPITPAHAAPK